MAINPPRRSCIPASRSLPRRAGFDFPAGRPAHCSGVIMRSTGTIPRASCQPDVGPGTRSSLVSAASSVARLRSAAYTASHSRQNSRPPASVDAFSSRSSANIETSRQSLWG